MVYPARLVQQLRSALRIVRHRADHRIEIRRSWRKGRRSHCAHPATDNLDCLLPVNQHRQCLTHSLIGKERSTFIPTDVNELWNLVGRFRKAFVEGRATGLFVELDWLQARNEVELTAFQCRQCGRTV